MTAPFVNFHTHHEAHDGELAIRDNIDTWGIHPWHADGARLCPAPDDVLAIGECGLDKACQTPADMQTAAFRHCIAESERLERPLILHCVRAAEQCLALRNTMRARQPWVWHGYRGNATLLNQLLPHGFLFSFGPRYNEEAVKACPIGNLFLETDDKPQAIQPLYTEVAGLLGVSREALAQQVWDNCVRLFGQDFTSHFQLD